MAEPPRDRDVDPTAPTNTPPTVEMPPRTGPADAGPATDLANRYRILKRLGGGGQGTVYRAFDNTFHRIVAVKVYLLDPSRPDARERALDEARKLSRVEHPHIVKVLDAGICAIAGAPAAYVAMEEIAGATMISDYCTLKGCSIAEICRLTGQIAGALGALHNAGQIHRDVKPGNILVSTAGEAKLVDLGISADFSTAAARETAPSGTPRFMAPEQLSHTAGIISPRTDVYGLGKVLTGLLPEKAPARLTDLARKMTAERPEHRPTGMAEVRHALLDIADVLAPTRRLKLRASPWLAVLAMALGLPPITTAISDIDTRLNISGWQWSRLITHVPHAGQLDHWKNVICVTLTDTDNLDALATSLGTPSPDPADTRSLRRMHGKMVEKIAAAEAKVIAVDIFFPSSTPFDSEMAASVNAVMAPVIFGTSEWEVTRASSRPTVIFPELSHAPRGGLTVHSSRYSPLMADVIVTPDDAHPVPSLSLLAAFAFNGLRVTPPDADGAPAYRIQLPDLTIWAADKQASLFSFSPTVASIDSTLPESAWVGRTVVEMPPDAEIAQSTLTYSQVCTATPEQLKQRLAGKIVLLANARTTGRRPDPRFVIADGRQLPGYLVHASAIDSLTRTLGAWPMPSFTILGITLDSEWLLGIFAAAAGGFTALRFGLRSQLATLAVTIGACLFITYLAWALGAVLAATFLPCVLAMLAFVLVDVFVRLRSWLSSRRPSKGIA